VNNKSPARATTARSHQVVNHPPVSDCTIVMDPERAAVHVTQGSSPAPHLLPTSAPRQRRDILPCLQPRGPPTREARSFGALVARCSRRKARWQVAIKVDLCASFRHPIQRVGARPCGCASQMDDLETYAQQQHSSATFALTGSYILPDRALADPSG
jgi:hypothetical protein